MIRKKMLEKVLGANQPYFITETSLLVEIYFIFCLLYFQFVLNVTMSRFYIARTVTCTIARNVLLR